MKYTENQVKLLLQSHNIEFEHLVESNQGQTHQGFFVDRNYYLKLYTRQCDYQNALGQNGFGPRIIAYKTTEWPWILFELIQGKTVAELLIQVNQEQRNVLFHSYVHILKTIHSHTDNQGRTKIHGDFHIGNIIVCGNDLKDLNNYAVIDRDSGRFADVEGEYGVIAEMIACPAAMVSESLEQWYEDKDLYELLHIFDTLYPEFIGSNPKGFVDQCKIRAQKKFDFQNGANERANRMGYKILELGKYILKRYG